MSTNQQLVENLLEIDRQEEAAARAAGIMPPADVCG
jgi:hypothetical protein